MQRLTSDQALQRVATFGLPSADPAPFTVDSPDRLLQRAEAQRIGVRLDRAVSAGIVVCDDAAWRTLCRDRAIAAAETTLSCRSRFTWSRVNNRPGIISRNAAFRRARNPPADSHGRR